MCLYVLILVCHEIMNSLNEASKCVMMGLAYLYVLHVFFLGETDVEGVLIVKIRIYYGNVWV